MGFGNFLERRGRRDEAVVVYDQIIQSNPADGLIQAARDRAAAGRPAPPPANLREGAAGAPDPGRRRHRVGLARVRGRLSATGA